MESRKWEDIATAKREALSKSIPPEWNIPNNLIPLKSQLDVTKFPEQSGWFTQKELSITSKTASEILPKLASGEWTSVEVTSAFCKRAAAAHQLLNCLSDTLFDSALQKAAELDAYLASHGRPKGPFHGLPISLKDNFNIAGRDSTLGFVSWVNDPIAKNSVLVDLLEEAGAVVYVKTNVPTAMMIAETVNNTFGRTLNPLNRNLTSGGSSGGESALIAFGGSCLGVGSDIGGSLRIPAACTGIYTIRPSFGRFPTYGTRSGLAGQEAVNSVNGPLARSIDDLLLYSKAVIEAKPWTVDPKCLPLPWKPVKVGPKLKIGIMWDDSIVRPTPPVTRALKEVVEKLKIAGHEIIEWQPTGHQQGLQLLADMFVADGGKSLENILNTDEVKEPFRPELTNYEQAKEVGVYDMWQMQLKKSELCKAYLDRWRASNGMDAILCATMPYASVKHGDFAYVGYTGIFNVLDYSAVSFPSETRVDAEKDAAYEPNEPLSPICQGVQEKYSAKDVHGMPISLQLVAQRLEEEKVLAMLDIVNKAL